MARWSPEVHIGYNRYRMREAGRQAGIARNRMRKTPPKPPMSLDDWARQKKFKPIGEE